MRVDRKGALGGPRPLFQNALCHLGIFQSGMCSLQGVVPTPRGRRRDRQPGPRMPEMSMMPEAAQGYSVGQSMRHA